MEGISR